MNATEAKHLILTVIPNGEHQSLIADDGTIYATGRGSQSMLRDAAWPADRAGYTHIMIGAQSWEVARLMEI